MIPAGSAALGRPAKKGVGASRPRGVPYLEVQRLDARLAELARGESGVRLTLGELLEVFAKQGGHHELGFSSLEAYAREHCGRSARWAVESRTLARRLAVLPALRAALAVGAVGWCMAELVARHATPETERELTQLAARSTVRAMRGYFAQQKVEAPSQMSAHSGEDVEWCTIELTLSQQDAWMFEWTRRWSTVTSYSLPLSRIGIHSVRILTRSPRRV